jgi:hypothetical protein
MSRVLVKDLNRLLRYIRHPYQAFISNRKTVVKIRKWQYEDVADYLHKHRLMLLPQGCDYYSIEHLIL